LVEHHGHILTAASTRLLTMVSWSTFAAEAPALAEAVQARFTAVKHSVLGTIRADGTPRLSGLETPFREGQLYLAMMPDARKADDLRRDPRFALHSSPDVDLVDGDAKATGRAVPVDDVEEIARFTRSLPFELPPSGMALFRADLVDATLSRVEGDFMVIDFWRPGEGVRTVRRR
jgi:hypothetical protein